MYNKNRGVHIQHELSASDSCMMAPSVIRVVVFVYVRACACACVCVCVYACVCANHAALETMLCHGASTKLVRRSQHLPHLSQSI